ncbi:MAG: neutral zinc metallopeptidase [Chloroflexota bacterium]
MDRIGRRRAGRAGGWLAVATIALGAMAGGWLPAAAQSPDPAESSDAAGSPTADSLDATEQEIAAALSGDDQSLQAYWAEAFPTFSDQPYHDPQGGFFPYNTGDPSGGGCSEDGETAAQNAMYCGKDESITYDVTWLASLYDTWGPVGPLMLMAHEWGHHIQAVAGTPETSKAAELQADCYAGMYLGFLRDQEVLTDEDIANGISVAYSIGDTAGSVTDWMDPEVHGLPNERRQATGIGYVTGNGAYCAAYGDWQNDEPAALFSDKSLRLEPFADPTPQEDGSLSIELPDAQVLVWGDDFDPSTPAADQIGEALTASVAGADTWTTSTPDTSWLETMGWGTGSGTRLTFTGEDENGNPTGGAAALQIDPSGTGELWVAWGADTTDADVASQEGDAAIDALAWGYCDPEAEVNANCLKDAPAS